MISISTRKILIKRGGIMFLLVPLVLGAFSFSADKFNLDVVNMARLSAVLTMFILGLFILSPLYLPINQKEKYVSFIYFWVCTSTIFNVTWQIPLIFFKDIITTAEVTHENLYKFIAWWGYGFADTHYGKVSNWMISEEIWWFLAIIISTTGLLKIKNNQNVDGLILLGIGELFKFYNASLYMVYDTVNGFQNIPIRDWISWMLYWGLNPLWALCALMAGIFSFNIVRKTALTHSD